MNHRLLPIGLLVALWALLTLGGSSSFLRDPGTFWHIRCGNMMLDERAFIQQDTFSFTMNGQVWQPHGWIGELILALLHRIGGFDALLLASCLLLAGLYSWLTARYLQLGLNFVFVLALLGVVLAASASHFHARPHLLTMLYLAILGHQLLNAESGRLSRLWWLVPLLIFWANTHGGVLAGIFTFGLTLAGWLVAWAIGFPTPIRGWRDAMEVTSLGLAAVLTLFVNPYGSSLVLTIMDLARMPELPRIIQEHAPLDFTDAASWPFLICGGIYFFGLGGLREKPRITWLVPIIWFALGISRVRHGSLFCVLMFLTLADLFPRTIWAKMLADRRPDFYQPGVFSSLHSGWIAFMAITLLGVGLVLQVCRVEAPIIGSGTAKLNPKYVPLELIPIMKEQVRSQTKPRLFNELNFGGFVIYFTPEYANFVDDRCELYGGKWLESYTEAEHSNTAKYLQEMQATHGAFDFALTIKDSGFDQHFRKHPDQWQLLKETEAASFFKRRAKEEPVRIKGLPPF
jgi:hypothetical protein